MAKVSPRGIFPSQAVSDAEKRSTKYGLEIAKAVESEWFKKDSGGSRFFSNRDNFHNLRLYARGEQSIKKYKDELSINGDLSYLNLDWKPVPIIPKFVDIVVNGIAERAYDLKAYSIDNVATAARTKYVQGLVEDMRLKDFKTQVQQSTGLDTFKNDKSKIPESEEELSLHMQLDYKQAVEIAQEEAITNVFDLNKYDLLKKRLDYDIAVLGIGCVKNSFNTAEGIKLDYVDPSDIVYSYTDSPYFEDLYYVGEVRRVSIVELKKQFPELTDEDIEEIEGKGDSSLLYNRTNATDKNYVYILYFEYKTYENQVYKVKETVSGGDKAIKKDDKFNPPSDSRSRFQKVNRSIECLYEGAKIVGHDTLLKWGKAVNMTRPKSDITKVQKEVPIS